MSTLISYSHLPLFLPVQDGQYRLMFLVPRLAGGPAGHRLAPQHRLREPLRPRLPPHHLPRPGPTLWSTPGGGKPGPNLRQQHEARQASVLRSVPSDRDQRWKGLQREREPSELFMSFLCEDIPRWSALNVARNFTATYVTKNVQKVRKMDSAHSVNM